MAVRNIRKEGDEVLRVKCKPVKEITEGVLRLIAGNTLSSQNVQMDNTADGSSQETHGGDGKTEAFAAYETIVHFVQIAVVHGLSGTLAVAQRQQKAGCFQKFCH